jgi:integrase
MSSAMEIDLPYLYADDDRYGRRRYYVRRYKHKIRIRERPGTPAFTLAYNEGLAELNARRAGLAKPPRAGALKLTLGWLALRYFGSEEFGNLEKDSQKTRRAVIESCLIEPRKTGSPDLMRDCPLAHLTARHIKLLRDRKPGLPGAANNRRKYLSAMFGWAIENDEGNVTINPCRDVRRKKYATSGFHTWTVDEARHFLSFHPIGTKAHLAGCLLLFLGGRPSDTAKYGRQHLRNGEFGYAPHKTAHLRRDITYKPVLPPLQRAIDAGPCGDLTFLVTDYGKPFSNKGFGNKIREWCDEAGLAHCTAHGLRKAGATMLAEEGATVPQLMAIYDWTTARQAEVYFQAANRKRMAAEAMPKLARATGME